MKIILFMKWMKRNYPIDIWDGILFIAPLILFSPVLMGEKALFWGTTILQFIPWRHLAVQIIRQGQLPLWNPYSGMGAPLLANYQSALLYPLNWIMMLLDYLGGVEWSAIGQGYFIAAHLILAGWGMRRFLRLMGLQPLGQTIGGLGYALGGYLVSRSSFQSILICASWIPWILYFATLVMDGSSNRKNFLYLTLSLMMLLLAGHAQTSWYALWMGTFWCVYLIWKRFQREKVFDIKSWIKALLPWVTAVMVAVLLSSGQLLPTLEYMHYSQRASGVASEIGLIYSFWPWRILTFFMPNLFGNPSSENYWGYGNYWEDAVYSGAMALPLAIYAIFSLRGKRRQKIDHPNHHFPKGIIFWWVLMLISIFLAFGKNLPFYSSIYDHFFLFNLFQAPTRITIITQFGLAYLAGVGIDSWKKPMGKRLYWLRLAIAGGFAILITAGLFHYFNREFYPTIVLSVILLGLQAIIFGCILLYTPDNDEMGIKKLHKYTLWSILVIAYFMFDLIGFQWGLNPAINADVYEPLGADQIPQQIIQGRGILLPEDEYLLKFNDYFRFDTFEPKSGWESVRFTWLPNINLFDRVSLLNNFDPLVPQSFSHWMKSIDDAQKSSNEVRLARLLKLSSVQWIVERESEGRVKITPFAGLERARIVNCAVVLDNQEAILGQLFSPEANIDKVVYLYSKELSEQNDCERLDDNPKGSLQWIENSPNRIKFLVTSQKNGWLVIHDINYPGWIAKVNGNPTKIYSANYLFRAIPLQASNNEVVLIYQPWSFFIGLAVSLITSIGLICFSIYKNNAHS